MKLAYSLQFYRQMTRVTNKSIKYKSTFPRQVIELTAMTPPPQKKKTKVSKNR